MKKAKKTFFSIAVLITAANFLGKILGFFRDLLISYYYGTSEVTDAFFMSIAIPTMLLGVFTSSADSIIIPQYNRILNGNDGRDRADRYFSNIINILCIVAFLLSIIILFFPDIVINIFSPNIGSIQKNYMKIFLKIFSFNGLLHILYCFLSAYNACYSRYLSRAVLSFSTGLIVVAALIINPDPNMIVVSIAYMISILFEAFLPFVESKRSGYKYSLTVTFDEDFQKFTIAFLPIMCTAFLSDLNMFVDKFLASGMGTGSISGLNYAYRIISLFDNILVISIGLVILPYFSKLKLNGKSDDIMKGIKNIISLILVLFIPITVYFIFMNMDIIKILYYRGDFGINSVIIVSEIFGMYIPQVLFVSLQLILIKIFHSLEDTIRPMKVTALTIISNIVLSIMLSKVLGLRGIALSTSISTILSVYLLWKEIKKFYFPELELLRAKYIINMVIFSLISLCPYWLLKNICPYYFLNVFIGGVLGVIIYSLILFIFNKKFIMDLILFLKIVDS